MVINWNKESNDSKNAHQLTKAAEYVRMSTEHQKYSTDNQSAEIRRYAERKGFEIVRTYADAGKSGLRLDGRTALKRLLNDIDNEKADFEAVLVYDVSRWGRFQDPDEAAHYELHCKRAGIHIHYCAEQFENDGSVGSSIIKTVKRAMAGEYSRELSVKVFAGQSRLIGLGYRQGGAPGFGLRRMLIDESGDHKGTLERGQQKSITTDRVILVPGPEQEVETVKDIYRWFLKDEHSEVQIAKTLNDRGIRTDLGRAWTRGTIHQILINDKYAGNNVWGRTSFKLKGERIRNDPDEWIRSDGAFDAIIDTETFQAVQAVIDTRSQRLTDEEMLSILRRILREHGQLSGIIIDEEYETPSSSTFRSRFGSLLRAYSLVGYTPEHDYRYIEINRALRRLHPQVILDLISGIHNSGGWANQNPDNDLLHVSGEIWVAVVIARCKLTNAGSRRWKIRLDNILNPDLTICIRMDDENRSPHDYYLLPHLDMRQAVYRLAEHNGLSLDAYRFNSLDSFYELTARSNLRGAA